MTKEDFIKKYNVITGDVLYNYIFNEGRVKRYRRRILNDMINCIFSRETDTRLITIVGDRRRGKTTTLEQLLEVLLNNRIDSEDILYINGESTLDLMELCTDLLGTDMYKKKCIFIDEITEMKNMSMGIKRLSDRIKFPGNRIVISGTWSQIFYEYINDILLDRNILFELEQITFNDNKKYLNRNIKESINNGFYIQDINNDITFRDCIGNLINFIKLSVNYSKNIHDINDVDIKFFYYSFLILGKQLSVNKIKDYNKLLDEFEEKFGVYDYSPRLNKDKINEIINISIKSNQVFLRKQIYNSVENRINNLEIIPKNITIRKIYK